MRQHFEAEGIDASEHLLRVAYAEMELRRRDAEPVSMRLATTQLGPLRLDRLRTRLEFSAEVEPLGAWIFAEVFSGCARYTTHGVERAYLPGEALLIAQPTESYLTSIENADLSVLVVDPGVVDEIAQTDGSATEHVRFTGYRAVDARALAQFRATLAFLRHSVGDAEQVSQQPLVASNAARLLVATALATFPNTALLAPTTIDRNDAHPSTLRRAVAFIETNAHLDISLADIAAAAFVTIRAVQLAFRRHLGTTPTAYLRQTRLRRANDDLRAADPARDTVGAIAARWGFSDASRFARAYVAAFGERPVDTLRS